MSESLPLDTLIPDAIEPIVGWRAWTLRARGGWLELAPVVLQPAWVPRRPIRAFCHARKRLHRAPEWTCRCGVYALSRLGALASSYGALDMVAVVGSVALWGTVIEHASGYRAEFAYPDRIRLVCPRCMGERRVGIPDRLFRGEGSLWVPSCAEHAPAGEHGSLSAEEVQARLLSVYGVELLPVEALQDAGFRAGLRVDREPPVTRDVPRPRRRRSAVAPVLPLLALAALLGAGFLRPGPEPGREPASDASVVAFVPAASAVVREPRPRPRSSTRRERPPPRSGFALVCAEEFPGGVARIRACGHPRAVLLGFAESPAEPRSSCLADGAYTRKQGFSVCWFSLDPIEARILRLPGVRWWDVRL